MCNIFFFRLFLMEIRFSCFINRPTDRHVFIVYAWFFLLDELTNSTYIYICVVCLSLRLAANFVCISQFYYDFAHRNWNQLKTIELVSVLAYTISYASWAQWTYHLSETYVYKHRFTLWNEKKNYYFKPEPKKVQTSTRLAETILTTL